MKMIGTTIAALTLLLISFTSAKCQEKPTCPVEVQYDRFEDKTTELCSSVFSSKSKEGLKVFSVGARIQYHGHQPQSPFEISLSVMAGSGAYPGYPKPRFDDVKSIFILTDNGRVELALKDYKLTNDIENGHFIVEIAIIPLPEDTVRYMVGAKTVEARLGFEEFKFDSDALKAFQDRVKSILPSPPPKPASTPRRRRP